MFFLVAGWLGKFRFTGWCLLVGVCWVKFTGSGFLGKVCWVRFAGQGAKESTFR